jgi:hypothetical protein
MQSKKTKANKTYKRELAIALLIWFGYLVEVKDIELVEILVWPVFTYSALAFGIDWWGKSGGGMQQSSGPTYGRRGEHSGQRTGGEEQSPDHWHIDRAGRSEDY